MKKLIKITFPIDENELLLELQQLSEEDCSIVKSSKLSGTEAILILTAIIQLTDSTVKLVTEILSKHKKKNDNNDNHNKVNITIQNNNFYLNEISESELIDKLND